MSPNCAQNHAAMLEVQTYLFVYLMWPESAAR